MSVPDRDPDIVFDSRAATSGNYDFVQVACAWWDEMVYRSPGGITYDLAVVDGVVVLDVVLDVELAWSSQLHERFQASYQAWLAKRVLE